MREWLESPLNRIVCILVPIMMWPALAGEARAASLHPVADIAARVAGFAGSPGLVDPRLIVPACPQLQLAMADAAAVRVSCAAPAWTVFVPLAGQPSRGAPAPRDAGAPRPAFRRGDVVQLAAAGPGFLVTLEAVADRDADADRLWVRTATGRRLLAHIGADGQLRLKGTW